MYEAIGDVELPEGVTFEDPATLATVEVVVVFAHGNNGDPHWRGGNTNRATAWREALANGAACVSLGAMGPGWDVENDPEDAVFDEAEYALDVVNAWIRFVFGGRKVRRVWFGFSNGTVIASEAAERDPDAVFRVMVGSAGRVFEARRRRRDLPTLIAYGGLDKIVKPDTMHPRVARWAEETEATLVTSSHGATHRTRPREGGPGVWFPNMGHTPFPKATYTAFRLVSLLLGEEVFGYAGAPRGVDATLVYEGRVLTSGR